ncbi:Uncharacterised protein [Escherichia coli]|nr:Uncharacterised protein [Escherichia coli]
MLPSEMMSWQPEFTDKILGSVSESKLLLGSVQKLLVLQQADEYIYQHIRCPHFLTKSRIKGQQKIQYRTLFGIIPVSGLRVYQCHCEESATKTVSQLSDWADTHPARKYIDNRWASLLSYEMTARLLKDVLPVGYSLNASTVRSHLYRVAQCLEKAADAVEQRRRALFVTDQNCSPE